MKVSIITASYNSERSIQKTIDSVACQDYKDIEYIIIDGGSTDKTLSIIKKNSTVISAFISEKDTGIYNALNKGIKMATGDIIGFLNSDDVYAGKDIVSKIADSFLNNNADIVYGNLIYQFGEHSYKKTIRYWKSNAFVSNSLIYGWMPPHPTLYCKKSIYETYGCYNENYKISADYEFILRVFSKSNIKKIFLPEIMVKMEIGGISNRSLKNILHKTTEDYRAIKSNNVGGILTVFFKNIRKFNQFNKLKNNKLKC
jgi:glycosyltransferase involved in cell wall biosynthesis